jgi:steroid delta-isomerase-like uncharacterized protein
MSIENKVVAKRLYSDVWNKRKLELLPEIISPSHALRDPNLSDAAIGPEAYKRQVNRFLTAFPDLRFSVEEMISEKDMLVVSWTITGTHKGEFWGVAPTNKKISMDGITINHIANGKIMDSDISMDALGLMRQLGAFPAREKVEKAKSRSAG